MLSVIIPARNEESAIVQSIESVRAALAAEKIEHEIVVIDDGSSDATGALARAAGVRVIRHPDAGGYGRALKAGIAGCRYDLVAITDADGTYPLERLPELVRLVVDEGFDMAVGARTGEHYRGTFAKMPARRVFLWLSEYATGRKIDDINSGLRVFRRELVTRFGHTIGDRFSFTTTITLAAMLNGYFVKYIPIEYRARIGESHVRYWRDSLRSLQIIVENILYYNPLKLFLLLVNTLLLLGGAALAALLLVPSERVGVFLAVLAATSLAAAFVVAAIGLAADLERMTRRAPDRGADQAPGRAPVNDQP